MNKKNNIPNGSIRSDQPGVAPVGTGKNVENILNIPNTIHTTEDNGYMNFSHNNGQLKVPIHVDKEGYEINIKALLEVIKEMQYASNIEYHIAPFYRSIQTEKKQLISGSDLITKVYKDPENKNNIQAFKNTQVFRKIDEIYKFLIDIYKIPEKIFTNMNQFLLAQKEYNIHCVHKIEGTAV